MSSYSFPSTLLNAKLEFCGFVPRYYLSLAFVYNINKLKTLYNSSRIEHYNFPISYFKNTTAFYFRLLLYLSDFYLICLHFTATALCNLLFSSEYTCIATSANHSDNDYFHCVCIIYDRNSNH